MGLTHRAGQDNRAGLTTDALSLLGLGLIKELDIQFVTLLACHTMANMRFVICESQ